MAGDPEEACTVSMDLCVGAILLKISEKIKKRNIYMMEKYYSASDAATHDVLLKVPSF